MRIVATLLIITCYLRPSRSLTPRWNGHGGQSNGREAPKIQIQAVPEKDDDDLMVMMSVRGGAASNGIIRSAKASLSKTLESTKQTFSTISKSIRQPTLPRFLRSKQDKQAEDLMKELQTTLVLNVKVPNTTVLPEEVIQVAAKRSGMLGRPLRTESVQEFARSLKRWYERKGYVLHSVTGATLHAETNTAEIAVQEPYIHRVPVDITYCKEMVIDDDGSLLSFRQYKDIRTRRDPHGLADLKKDDLNTTFIATTGKTNPDRIAKTLQLNPQTPFQWQGQRWQAIVGSGIFSRVLQATPERMADGTVQLQIIATEAPPRNLEYGLSKSLYTGSWEGEVDFQHGNVLGGGESLGVTVKRGTTDAEPSVRVKFKVVMTSRCFQILLENTSTMMAQREKRTTI
jgi:outer membrane protein assembly factor BamA